MAGIIEKLVVPVSVKLIAQGMEWQMFNDNRLGRFSIPVEVIDDEPELVQAIMGAMIVVRAELMWQSKSMCYEAISSEFAPVEPGMEMPFYDIDVNVEGEDVTVSFVKKV